MQKEFEQPQEEMKLMEKEIKHLVEQLQWQYDRMHAEYQKIPHESKIGTVGLVSKKQEAESALDQIQITIEELSKPRGKLSNVSDGQNETGVKLTEKANAVTFGKIPEEEKSKTENYLKKQNGTMILQPPTLCSRQREKAVLTPGEGLSMSED